MTNEPTSPDGKSAATGQRPSADILPFKSKTMKSAYGIEGIKALERLGKMRKRSDVTWLGECQVPVTVLHKLSRLLDKHPELRAMKILDHNGAEMTLWTGNLPNGYG